MDLKQEPWRWLNLCLKEMIYYMGFVYVKIGFFV